MASNNLATAKKLLAIFVLANVAMFAFVYFKGRTSEASNAELVRIDKEWKATDKAIAAVKVDRSAQKDGNLSIGAGPQPDSEYQYCEVIHSSENGMRALVSGRLSFQPAKDGSISATQRDTSRWQLDRTLEHSMDLSKRSASVALFDRSSTASPTPVAFLTGKVALGTAIRDKLATYAEPNGSWTGTNETLGDQPSYQIVGQARVGSFDTIVVEGKHDISRGLSLVHDAEKDKNVGKSLLAKFANFDASEEANLYVDIATGLLVRKEAKMIMKPKGTFGGRIVIESTYQLMPPAAK